MQPKNSRPSGKRFQGKRRKSHSPRQHAPRPPAPVDLESTGQEAAYFRQLIDAEVPVVIVLKTGEQLRGYVRYYDRDVFSLGQEVGPKLFLRKESVRYLYEA